MVVISASASQEDLIRVRSELERINRDISFEGTEWDDRNYLRTYASSLSSAQGSVGQHIDYTDINRHLPVVMYNFKESTGGLVSEGELSTELLLKCMEGSCGGGMENIEDELLIISSFTKEILSYKDFTTSIEFETEQRKFDNERNWSKLFYQDLENGTHSFTYLFDGKEMSVSDIKEQYKLRDVRDVSVTQKNPGKDVFMIQSSPYKGFQSHQTSFRHLTKRTPFATFMKESKEEIVATKKTYPDSQVKYFYEGLEDEDILETIDSSYFKFMAIETGNNFTNLGNFLGHEIRVHFNKD